MPACIELNMAGFHLTVLSWMYYISVGVISSINGESDKRMLMEVNYSALVQRLDALESEVAALKRDAAQPKHQPVVFLAETTTTVTGSHQHIYFETVKLNEGNAYNPHHGTFVAPVNGTYQFTITACSQGGHYIVLDLTVNTDVIGSLIGGDSAYSACSSKVFFVHLKALDDVYVKHESAGDYLLTYPAYGLPSFGGFLIHTD